jgi:hypothetical protein
MMMVWPQEIAGKEFGNGWPIHFLLLVHYMMKEESTSYKKRISFQIHQTLGAVTTPNLQTAQSSLMHASAVIPYYVICHG